MSGIICKTRSREKRQCEPEEGKRKQNRNKRTAAYLWELDQIGILDFFEYLFDLWKRYKK